MKTIKLKLPSYTKSMPDEDFLDGEDMAVAFQVRCPRTVNHAVTKGLIPEPTHKMDVGVRYPKNLWRLKEMRKLEGQKFTVPGRPGR